MTKQTFINDELDAALKEIRADQAAWFAARRRQAKIKIGTKHLFDQNLLVIIRAVGEYLANFEKCAAPKGRCRRPAPRPSA